MVEAALRSGALNTSTWADRLQRVLMAAPGPLTSAASEGAHQLLRSGAAALVTGGEDVLELVGRAGEDVAPTPRAPQAPRDVLDVRTRQVLDAVPVASSASLASIARVAGVAPQAAETGLAALLAHRLVEQTAAGWRVRRTAPDEPGAGSRDRAPVDRTIGR